MINIPINKKRIHFIGIGGIGMSGIAEMCHKFGHKVSGSDLQANQNINRLKSLGIKVSIGHDKGNIKASDIYAVVCSSAISLRNCELRAAKQAGIPIITRANLLAELMAQKLNITVSGSHGKSSTTAIIGSILDYNGYDPTIINGGIINRYNSTIKNGSGGLNVVEADESDGSFLDLPSYVSVVTNIDCEHLDYYKTEKKLITAFEKFIKKAPFYGCAVLCLDDENIKKIISRARPHNFITYGFNGGADFTAQNININKDRSLFDVYDKRNDKHYKQVSTSLLGRHNILNCLAAMSVCSFLGLNINKVIEALQHLSGVQRRFTTVGYAYGAEVIDDYGHHPREIENVLMTAREICSNKLHVVFQPHRYSRVKTLFSDFIDCFSRADEIYLLEVYAASEKYDSVYNEDLLFREMSKRYGAKVQAIFGKDPDLTSIMFKKVEKGDMIIFLGAGSITYLANNFPEAAEEYEKNQKKTGDKHLN